MLGRACEICASRLHGDSFRKCRRYRTSRRLSYSTQDKSGSRRAEAGNAPTTSRLCIRAGHLRDREHVLDIEIGLDRPLGPANLVAFVSFEMLERLPALVRIDRYGADSHFGPRPHHANDDLVAIGDQKYADATRANPVYMGVHIDFRVAQSPRKSSAFL